MTPTHFIFSNLGDSRTLLCRQGRLAFQTRDHKPTLPQERQRIRNAGGYVINARVDGGLAISRAFGDFDYKMRSDLSPLQQKVGLISGCDTVISACSLVLANPRNRTFAAIYLHPALRC